MEHQQCFRETSEVTDLRGQTCICKHLLLPAEIAGFLLKSVPPKCCD